MADVALLGIGFISGLVFGVAAGITAGIYIVGHSRKLGDGE